MKRKDTAVTGAVPAGDQQSFETMMERLQALVDRLEEGNLTLEDSIRSFEEGMDLVRRCTEVLNQAEQRITELTRDAAGRPVERAVEAGEENGGTGGDELPF